MEIVSVPNIAASPIIFCYSNSYQESEKTMNADLRNWGIVIDKRSCKTNEWGLTNTN